MKKLAMFAAVVVMVLSMFGCAPKAAPAVAPAAAGKKEYKDMTLCYPQLGAESDWRTANSASIKEEADKLKIKKLVFSDAQQKPENQISAVRSCIQQGVDVIALPPVVEDGWDAVLTEAKNAKIPVIIVDRSVKADSSLYAAHIGSNMELEDRRRYMEIVLRNVAAGVVSVDAFGNVITINNSAAALFGLKAEDVRGETIRFWYVHGVEDLAALAGEVHGDGNDQQTGDGDHQRRPTRAGEPPGDRPRHVDQQAFHLVDNPILEVLVGLSKTVWQRVARVERQWQVNHIIDPAKG